MPRKIPVYRDDGKWYSSCLEAARCICEENNLTADQKHVINISNSIRCAAMDMKYTAYGHRWNTEDVFSEPIIARFKKLVQQLYEENKSLRERLLQYEDLDDPPTPTERLNGIKV